MQHISTRYISWFIVLIFGGLMVLAVSLLIQHIHKKNVSAVSPQPDVVTVSVLPDGGNIITNKTAGYQVALPQDWYFEKSAGGGVTVYPNYDPNGDASPECKIMISALPNPGSIVLDDWLKAYFAEDTTADIEQESVTGSEISEQPAIVWSGSENGVSTTLAYIAHSDSVYEIAPSSIEDTGSTSTASIAHVDDTCATAFQSLLATFTFLPQ